MTKQSFLRGALVLIGASVTTKIIGMIMQVIINRELGAEGFGLFRSVSPIFGLLITLGFMGLPPALSKVVAEAFALGDLAKIRRAMRVSVTIVTVLSIALTGVLILFAPMITAKWLDHRAYLPLIAAAVWAPLICVSWIVRCFYMGIQNQTPPSIAWILETIARTGSTVPLVYWAMAYGLQYAAVAVMIGMGIGELVGFLYMYWFYRNRDRHLPDLPPLQGKPESPRRTVVALAEVAVPTVFRNILGSLTYALEPFILYMAFANVGIAKGAATTLYGSMGMAVQLLLLPTVFSSSISAVLVPAVSEAAALQNSNLIRQRLYQTIRATLLLGLPATAMFMLMGKEVSVALYRDELSGSLLSYVAPICIFIYLRDPLSGILQGLNRTGLSTVISLFASAIKLLCIYYFVNKPGLGIYGVADAIAIHVIIGTLLHLYFVRKYVGFESDWLDTVKMLTAVAFFTLIVYQVKLNMADASPAMRILSALLIGGVLYTIALFALKIVRADTLERIPRVGPKIASVLRLVPFFR